MLEKINRLTKTKKGIYGYRRKVAEKYRSLFDFKTEIVKSFGTKHLSTALRLHKEMDRWFGSVIATKGYRISDPTSSPKEKVLTAVKDLQERNLYPHDLPKIDVLSEPETLTGFLQGAQTASEIAELKKSGKISSVKQGELVAQMKGNEFHSHAKYLTERSLLKAHLQNKYTDWPLAQADMLNPDVDTGTDTYVPPQCVWDDNDLEVIKYRVMLGEIDVTPDPTWSDVMYNYLKKNMGKRRNEDQRNKHENATKSFCERLGSSLSKGMKTPLSSLDRTSLEAFCEEEWPNASTRDRACRSYQAMLNSWNTYNPTQAVENHFKIIISENQSNIEHDTQDVRSMTREEWLLFWGGLEKLEDAEMKIIGMLCAYCGCPAGEAAGLVRDDLKLKSTPPHIVFRSNEYRYFGKGRLERVTPLVEPLLSVIINYIETDYAGGELLFPRYAVGKHVSAERSSALAKLVVNKRPKDKRLLRPYSLRHTFKDRYQAAKVDPSLGQYLMGHKTRGSSAIHERYGTGRTPDGLVLAMNAIVAVTEHGYFEEYD